MDTSSEASSSPTLSWTAPEFEGAATHPRAPLVFIGIFLGIVVYALVVDSPIMAITFVLLAAVTFLHSRKPARTLECALTKDGIRVGNELYTYENISSFWILYESGEKSLFLKTKGALISSVRIPIGNINPNTLRSALINTIRETPYEPTLIDTLSRFLHI